MEYISMILTHRLNSDDNPEGVRAQETIQRLLVETIESTHPDRKDPDVIENQRTAQ